VGYVLCTGGVRLLTPNHRYKPSGGRAGGDRCTHSRIDLTMGWPMRSSDLRRRKRRQSSSCGHGTPARKVRFLMPPRVCRSPKWDERFVISEFEKHIATCPVCCYSDFHDRWRRPRVQSLCQAGHNFAHDLLDYLYSWRGRVYSVFETYLGSPVEVLYSERWISTRTLLVSVEHGLKVGHYPHRKSYRYS